MLGAAAPHHQAQACRICTALNPHGMPWELGRESLIQSELRHQAPFAALVLIGAISRGGGKGQLLHAKKKHVGLIICQALLLSISWYHLLPATPDGEISRRIKPQKPFFQHLLLGERGLLWQPHLAYSHEFYKERNK